MKKINKNMRLSEIMDAICELEGYEEHLEYTLDHTWNAQIREKSRAELKEAKRKLTILHTMLEYIGD